MHLLAGNSLNNLDVVMKVLLPETLIKMFMDLRNVPYDQAEEQLLEGDFPEEEVPVEEVFMRKTWNVMSNPYTFFKKKYLIF